MEGRSRADLDAVLVAFGFERRGRHWVFDDLFVEVPGNWMSDPVDTVALGGLSLRVVKAELDAILQQLREPGGTDGRTGLR